MSLNIKVNDVTKEIQDGATVADLATAEGITGGAAIAVNDRLVPRRTWADTRLNDNDNVVIIKAAYGG